MPTESEKYGSADMDYKTMSEASAAMVLERAADVVLHYQSGDDRKIKPVTDPQTIVGKSQIANLSELGSVWLSFSEDEALNRQITDQLYTVYIVYSEFDKTFSSARISIGYSYPIVGQKITLPSGKRIRILSPGKYSEEAVRNSWKDIDFIRPVKAVLEKREYEKGQETISLYVIYQ